MVYRWDCIEQKVYLSMGGIIGVLMGIIVSYGLCSALGFFYSAAHAVMPFLLLGIGIDDMFVIVQCLNTLTGTLQVFLHHYSFKRGFSALICVLALFRLFSYELFKKNIPRKFQYQLINLIVDIL